jgi:hypothetical protein
VTQFHSQAEDHLFEQLVRENPKRDDENQMDYLARIGDMAAARMPWRRDGEAR